MCHLLLGKTQGYYLQSELFMLTSLGVSCTQQQLYGCILQFLLSCLSCVSSYALFRLDLFEVRLCKTAYTAPRFDVQMPRQGAANLASAPCT